MSEPERVLILRGTEVEKKITLEQLPQTTPSKILAGQSIAKTKKYILNTFFVWRSARLLDRIIFRQTINTIYLSFLTSKLYKLLKKENTSDFEIQETNKNLESILKSKDCILPPSSAQKIWTQIPKINYQPIQLF